MTPCTLCQAAPPVADRSCAFDEVGRFISENRRCGTIHALQLAGFFYGSSKLPSGAFARLAGMPGFDGKFLLLGWTGDPANVHTAFVLRIDGAFFLEPLTLQVAEAVIEAKGVKLDLRRYDFARRLR